MKENIPQAIIEIADDLIKCYGGSLKSLGSYKGCEVYLFQFPENSFTGFPFVYLYDAEKNKALEITGEKALDILSSIKQ